jgi:cell division inhibitor SulA/protein ImuA
MQKSNNPTTGTQLSHPLLWRGQDDGSAETAAIATGFAALDRYLPGGGWPLTGISEIFVEYHGLGELSLLMPALAALSQRAAETKQWIVWVAPPFIPYAPALARHGVELSRVLLVHPAGALGARAARSASAWTDAARPRTDAQALWAVEQAIRSQASSAALAWIEHADMTALRRLQLGAEAHRCWTVLFRPAAAMSESSPAALRLKLAPVLNRTSRVGARVDIQKCRGRKPVSIVI